MKTDKVIAAIIIISVITLGSTIILSENLLGGKDRGTAGGSSVSEDISDDHIGSRIAINENSYDFGIVKYGDVARHTFEITNTGDSVLEILKISTSCGCTKAYMENDIKSIDPGKSETIIVTFDPAVHKDDSDIGNVVRIVYIKTNDKLNPEREIEIKANVVSPEKFKTINVTAQKWFFEPNPIKVKKGEYIELRISSKDTYHSFTVPELNINVELEPEKEQVVKFYAENEGTYSFYCAVPCGEGHKDMKGILIIE